MMLNQLKLYFCPSIKNNEHCVRRLNTGVLQLIILNGLKYHPKILRIKFHKRFQKSKPQRKATTGNILKFSQDLGILVRGAICVQDRLLALAFSSSKS